MIKKIVMILSYFLMPLIIIIFKNLETLWMNDQQITHIEVYIIIFWVIFFSLSLIATVIFTHIFKEGVEETRMDKTKIKILDSKYNIHIFEYWFLIISPCIIFSGTNIISLLAILFIFIIIAILLYRQNIFCFNIILIVIGYNFYLFEYEGNEYIICSMKSYSQLRTLLQSNCIISKIEFSNYYYVE